jgi:hypothetical protein
MESCKLRYFNSFEFFDHTAMVALNAHEAGNGGQGQGKAKAHGGLLNSEK